MARAVGARALARQAVSAAQGGPWRGLALEQPEMVWDLPAGGKRLIQKAQGYLATVCAGEVTFENGVATGAMPGRLLRGGRVAAAA